MLKFYLSSIIIWMIIIESIFFVFKDKLLKRTGITETKKTSLFTKIAGSFAVSALPIIRLTVAIMLVYTAVCSQEEFDEIIKKGESKN